MDRPLPLFPNRLLSRILTIAAVGLLLLFCNISGSGSGSLLGPEAAHAQALTAVATVNVVIPPVTLLELLQKTPPRFVAVTSEGDHILEQAVHVQVRSNVPWQLNLLAPTRLQVLIPQASPGTQDPDGPYYVLPGPRVLLFWAPHGSSSWQPLLPGRPVPVGPVSPPATGTELQFDLLVRPAPGERFEPGVLYQVDLEVEAVQHSRI